MERLLYWIHKVRILFNYAYWNRMRHILDCVLYISNSFTVFSSDNPAAKHANQQRHKSKKCSCKFKSVLPQSCVFVWCTPPLIYISLPKTIRCCQNGKYKHSGVVRNIACEQNEICYCHNCLTINWTNIHIWVAWWLTVADIIYGKLAFMTLITIDRQEVHNNNQEYI